MAWRWVEWIDEQANDPVWGSVSRKKNPITNDAAEGTLYNGGWYDQATGSWDTSKASSYVWPTQPAATQPAATQPAATQPAATQPAATQPAATQPAATQPAATSPFSTFGGSGGKTLPGSVVRPGALTGFMNAPTGSTETATTGSNTATPIDKAAYLTSAGYILPEGTTVDDYVSATGQISLTGINGNKPSLVRASETNRGTAGVQADVWSLDASFTSPIETSADGKSIITHFVNQAGEKRTETTEIPPTTAVPGFDVPTDPLKKPKITVHDNALWMVNEDGTESLIKDYSALYGRVQALETPQTFQEFLTNNGLQFQRDITDTSAYQGLVGLINDLTNGSAATQDMAGANRSTALAMGFTDTADGKTAEQNYAEWITENQNTFDAQISQIDPATGKPVEGFSPLSGYVGMGQAEKDAYARVQENSTRRNEEFAKQEIDSIMSGSTGNSSRRAQARLGEITRGIQDENLKADLELANMDWDRKKYMFEADYGQYKDALARGDMKYGQFLQMYRDNRTQALTGYAQQISTIMAQNSQYLNMYDADLKRISDAADVVYKQVQTELGIDENLMSMSQSIFDQYWASYGADLAQKQVTAAQNASDLAGWLNLAGTALKGIPIIGDAIKALTDWIAKGISEKQANQTQTTGVGTAFSGI